MLENYFCVLLIVIRVFSSAHRFSETEIDKISERDGQRNHSEFQKIAQFLDPLAREVKTEKCRKQMETFLEGLRNSSLWAVQMFDASAKLPQGFISSDTYDLGNHDECLDINLNRPKEDNIMGKYCLARFSLSQSTCVNDPNDSYQNLEVLTFEKLIVPALKSGLKNKGFRLGICVPHECTLSDVESMLQFLYNNATPFGCNIDVCVPDYSCSTNEEAQLLLGTIILRLLLSLFIGTVLVTILEVSSITYNFKIPVIIQQFIMPFSAYRNYNWLVFAHTFDRLAVLDSLKVYAVLLLTVINRYHLLLRGPILNRRSVEQHFRTDNVMNILDITNHFVTGTLLFVTGFLHYHRVYRLTRINTSVGIWRATLLQFLKILPLYVTTVFFYAFAYGSLGNGPLWKERIETMTNHCSGSLLGNLFSFKSYINITETCISEPWYFMVIAPYFLILPLIVSLTKKSSTTGSIVLGALTGVTLLIPFQMIYNLSTNSPNDNRRQQLTQASMSQTFTYFIGVATSVSYNYLRERKIQVFQLFSQTYVFSLIITYCGFYFITKSMNFPQAQFEPRPMIDTTGQLIWSVTIVGLILKISTQKLPYLRPLLTSKYLSFFGSFTYPYILILGLVQGYTTGTIRTIDYFSLTRLIWMSAADFVETFIIAFVFYMILHRPISTILENTLFKKMT